MKVETGIIDIYIYIYIEDRQLWRSRQVLSLVWRQYHEDKYIMHKSQEYDSAVFQ
jgi:hypothetical protein